MTGPWHVTDLPDRIAARITVRGCCWIISGKPNSSGYARIRGRSAARVVWELLVGPVDRSRDLDHREDYGCTSKLCVYPGHLLPVTHRVNTTRDGAGGVGAANLRKDACGSCGTPYDQANTYTPPGQTRRDCRACGTRRTREYRARQAARTQATLSQAA